MASIGIQSHQTVVRWSASAEILNGSLERSKREVRTALMQSQLTLFSIKLRNLESLGFLTFVESQEDLLRA